MKIRVLVRDNIIVKFMLRVRFWVRDIITMRLKVVIIMRVML